MENRLCRTGARWLESESLALASRDEWPGRVRLETHISYLHCYSVGSGGVLAFVWACCAAESRQLLVGLTELA